MSNKIKLTRDRNINAKRCKAGEVLVIGKDVSLGLAHTLVRIGSAAWNEEKKTKELKPVSKNKKAK